MAHASARILLIEPEPVMRELELQILTEDGYQVDQVTEHVDPVTFVAQSMPALIVIGMRENDPDKWQIVDRLRSDPQTATIPVVVVSTSPRMAAAAAASTNVSETVVAPYNISALESAVAAALGKPPAAAALPASPHPVPAYQVIAADSLQRESRAIVLRGLRQLLSIEPYRKQFRGVTPEFVDNLGLLLGAIVEGLRKDLPPDQVFAAEPVQKALREHIRLRKQQRFGVDTVIREIQELENQVDRALQGLVSASFSAADALVVIDKVREFVQALTRLGVVDYEHI